MQKFEFLIDKITWARKSCRVDHQVWQANLLDHAFYCRLCLQRVCHIGGDHAQALVGADPLGVQRYQRIGKAVKSFGVPDKINHKKIVIPGAVATISGELEEELPGWEIKVGPREAVDLPRFLKTAW